MPITGMANFKRATCFSLSKDEIDKLKNILEPFGYKIENRKQYKLINNRLAVIFPEDNILEEKQYQVKLFTLINQLSSEGLRILIFPRRALDFPNSILFPIQNVFKRIK